MRDVINRLQLEGEYLESWVTPPVVETIFKCISQTRGKYVVVLPEGDYKRLLVRYQIEDMTVAKFVYRKGVAFFDDEGPLIFNMVALKLDGRGVQDEEREGSASAKTKLVFNEQGGVVEVRTVSKSSERRKRKQEISQTLC